MEKAKGKFNTVSPGATLSCARTKTTFASLSLLMNIMQHIPNYFRINQKYSRSHLLTWVTLN